MQKSFLDRVYEASGNAEMRAIYDDWAAGYDSEVEQNGYLTPGRVAQTVAHMVPDRSTPILDFACGTGLSGAALSEAGFTKVDGIDLSAKMLEIARERGVYGTLRQVNADARLAKQFESYPVITAVGALGRGAAPASSFGELVELMEPGAILVFSLNDLSRSDPDYGGLVQASVDAGELEIVSQEHGPHLAKYGANSSSTIYALRRL